MVCEWASVCMFEIFRFARNPLRFLWFEVMPPHIVWMACIYTNALMACYLACHGINLNQLACFQASYNVIYWFKCEPLTSLVGLYTNKGIGSYSSQPQVSPLWAWFKFKPFKHLKLISLFSSHSHDSHWLISKPELHINLTFPCVWPCCAISWKDNYSPGK